MAVLRSLCFFLAVACTLGPAYGATLERLSLDDMIQKSTSIVRCRVESSRAVKRNRLIYTYTRVRVLEQWKGTEASSIEVASPGGALAGQRQEFSGVPTLAPGKEYVLFLWKGKSGTTYVIGLSQGVFRLKVNENGETVAVRSASQEVMLDPASGQAVGDRTLSFPLSQLRGRVQSSLAGAKQ